MTEWASGNPPVNGVRTLLHKLWTEAVGTAGYDKRAWGEFESQIEKLMEIHRALCRFIDERTPETEQDFWRLFMTYRQYIKVDETLKIDLSSLTEPPPGLFGKPPQDPRTN
jgi:hypothetical protein